MRLLLEPNMQNMILCSLIFVVSGIIILKTLKKFGMQLASKLFTVLFFVIGIYIPFYFLGTLATHTITAISDPSLVLYFLKHQLATLNAPFFLFESASLLIGIIAIVAIIALVIAMVFIVKIVATSIARSCSVRILSVNHKSKSVICYYYVPNYSNTYLFLKHLLN